MKTVKICVVGLGYVGMPLAQLFARHYSTIGFDCNKDKLTKPDDCPLVLTSDENQMDSCNVFVIAVPTPVDDSHKIDNTALISASTTVARHLKKDDVVIYESTVYPGLTEEVCVPILEQVSGMIYNRDFFVGYSPERINPGDKEHTVETIVKVTSGSTPETADFVDQLYSSVLANGTHRASSIRVAEASKIIENCQRDVLIAYMNELYKLFRAMGINVEDVRDAAATKWNFVKTSPGLVGGHCIAVDPYYLIEKAASMGIDMPLLKAARGINDGMGRDYAEQIIGYMSQCGIETSKASVLLLGIAYKSDSADIRNTLVCDVYNTLLKCVGSVTILDPLVSKDQVMSAYGIPVVSDVDVLDGNKYDAIAICTPHSLFADINVDSLMKPKSVYCRMTEVIKMNKQ